MEILTIIGFGLASVLIGIFAVVFGGTLFLSLPLFQILFPEMSLAAMIGSIKFGSVLRNAGALWARRREVVVQSLWLLLPLGVGTLTGALAISSMTQVVVPLVLLIGFVLSEKAATITIKQSAFTIVTFLVGFYAGIFGAGILLLLIALLQLRLTSLVHVRTNALLLEMLLGVVAVVVFMIQDIIVWHIAMIWALGGIVGGYIGGILIGYTGKLPQNQQQRLVRLAFVLALVVAVWQIITLGQ